jgi:nucleotide-binding universal stress UspA family protein
MYKHILIATDGSELATKALEHGLALAKRDNARVTVVTVTEPWSALDIAHDARQHRPDPIGHFEEIAAAARAPWLS